MANLTQTGKSRAASTPSGKSRFLGWGLALALICSYVHFRGPALNAYLKAFTGKTYVSITGDRAIPADSTDLAPELFHFLVDQRETRWLDRQDPIGI